MGSLLLTTIPRRRRLHSVVLLLLLIWALFLFSRFDTPRGALSIFNGGISGKVDILQYVDPLIGTVNGGHVFPGATLPYGMAKPVADSNIRGENAAGFVSDNSLILGFSQLHDSGTGGNPSLGNFPLFVHPGCPGDDYRNCTYPPRQRATARVNGSATARPGYFAIGLNNSVYAEMTATAHANLFRFTLPSQPKTVPNSPLILLDLDDLNAGRLSGNISIDPETGRMMGNGTFRPSFGKGQYNAHFCADFKGAVIKRTGTFVYDNATEEVKTILSNTIEFEHRAVGTWVQFQGTKRNQILVRVGVSFISTAQACANAENEIGDFDFSRVQKAAEAIWREKLSVIEADHTGLDHNMLTTFWSGLYRTMLSPQNYTGENPLWKSTEPYYDSFYCIWDSFRAQHPLLSIVDPEIQTDMVRALIDIYKHEGKLPDCRMSFSQGYTQGGSNADVVLADALVKNLTRDIDWTLGYEAVISDAEEEPGDWAISGRGSIEKWKTLGYIPIDDDTTSQGPKSRSISRTVEYAYDDFAIALMARKLGRTSDEQKYLARSKNWKNIWSPSRIDDPYDTDEDDMVAGWTVPNPPFKGFMQPRYMNGTWARQNTRLCSPAHGMHSCYFDTRYDTYEGSPWLYSFYVPQDMASLIAAMGGPQRFVERLDYFHSSGINYMGNEPNFLPTFQFHYAGRPDRSSDWVRHYIPSMFNSSVAGIPGNDDCAMGAFSAFAFMGFYPVAGQSVYLLTPPFFREISIRAPDGRRQATIRADGATNLGDNVYIQSARLNGVPYTRNWISHDFFARGGVLELTLGTQEGSWGTRPEDLPPSMSTGLESMF
ncbi:glycoside hydrolase family 92 protein [Xylariaceae sp. FL0255]|nr:glycoside hydrolase family 92 protein [Xylariaceae sp. FL0255]